MHLCSYNSHFVASLNKRTHTADIRPGRKDLWCLLLPWAVTILQFSHRSFCSTQKDDPAKQTNPTVPHIVDKANTSFYLHWVEGTKMTFCWQCRKATSNTLVCCPQTPSLLVSVGSPRSQGATEHGMKVARTRLRGHSWKQLLLSLFKSFTILGMPLHAHLFQLR